MVAVCTRAGRRASSQASTSSTGRGASKAPITSGWLTMTMVLHWTDDGWKITDFEQKDGPEPTDADVKFGMAPQL